MLLFDIGACVGGLGLIILLVLINDGRKNRPISKSTRIMCKAGGIMAIVGTMLALIGAVIQII